MDEERLRRVQVDVDTRLVAVWALVWETELYEGLDLDDLALLAGMLRAAYAVGYHDARDEIEAANAGDLARDNGYTKET